MVKKNTFKKLVKKIKQVQKNIEKKKQRAKKLTKTRKTTVKEEKVKIELDTGSVVKATAAVLLVCAMAYLIVDLRAILFIFFIAFLLAAGLDPLVDKLEEKKIPRWLSVIGMYILTIIFLTVFISQLIPLVANQLAELSTKIQDFFSNIRQEDIDSLPFSDQIKPYIIQLVEGIDVSVLQEQIQPLVEQLYNFGSNIWALILTVSNGLLNALFVLILTFFMVVEENSINKFIHDITPNKYGEYMTKLMDSIKKNVGLWLRGQLLLMFSVGILTFIGLVILGVENAVTISIIAGVTEMIPMVGPILAWLFVLPVAANDSALMVLWVSILFFLVQQIENNVLVPLIMNKAVGLSPIIIMFAMLVGFQYYGIIGIIIAIPVATTISIAFKDYVKKTNHPST